MENYKDKIEVWKDVVGYEGLYQVSNIGNVRSLDKYVLNRGKYPVLLKGRIMKPSSSSGYWMLVLYKNGKGKNLKIHRLMAKSFLPNKENKECINHKNGIKTDNNLENLEWCTISENNFHTWKMCLKKANPLKGELCKTSKLKNDDVLAIRASKSNCTELGVIYNVHKSSISLIKSGKTWRHLLAQQAITNATK